MYWLKYRKSLRKVVRKPCPRCASDDEVIRIADQVDLILPLLFERLGEPFRQAPLQSIQGPIRQGG